MLLKELEIQGFKSFPDKTKITFDRGITAVVGPNGSGKSNISDAIRWVLGETSSRQLRGSGKMEDVIFGGTQKRNAMGYAVVHLTVDNRDRRIEIDSDTVTICRKYYRSGESEYAINGQNVRLKDIYELFLDTGLGRNGYSMIGQGRIAEIISAKSNERREIFEEASGIARYRYRKNEAERRLQGAEENLIRLRDILQELEKRVEPLKADSKKAEQFLQLAEKKKQLEITLWCDTIENIKENLCNHQQKLDIAQQDYQKQNLLLQDTDQYTEQVRAEIQKLTIQIEQDNQNIRRQSEQIATAESKIAVLNNDIQHTQQAVAQTKQDLEDTGTGFGRLQEEVLVKKTQEQHLSATKQQLNFEIEQLEAELENLKQKGLQTEQQKELLTGQMVDISQKQTQFAIKAASVETALETLQAQLDGLNSKGQDFELEYQKSLQEKQENQRYLDQLTNTLQNFDYTIQDLQLRLKSKQKHLDTNDQQYQQHNTQMEGLLQRLYLLQDMEKNMEGYSGSVKAVIKAPQSQRLKGIIDPVSNLLQIKKGYELAIETALGAAAQNIVVENEDSAKEAIAFLKQQKAGRATFLPLDTIQAHTMQESALQNTNAIVATKVVETQSCYQKILANLLGRIIIAKDLQEASKVARKLQFRNRIVTVDGQVINAGGSYTGGSTSRTVGLFSRRQEMEDLQQKVSQMQTIQQQLLSQNALLKKELDEISKLYNQSISEQQTLQEDKIRAKAEQNRLQSLIQQYTIAKELQNTEKQEITKQIQQYKEELTQLQQQSKQLQNQSEILQQQFDLLMGGDQKVLSHKEQILEVLSGKRLDLLSIEKDLQLTEQQILQLNTQSEENLDKTSQLKKSIVELHQKITDYQQQIRQMVQEQQQSKQNIQQLEQNIQQSHQQRMEKEGAITQQNQQMRTITQQQEGLTREISRLEEQKKTMEAEYDQTVAKLWDEYQLTFSYAKELCIDFESAIQLKQQVSWIRDEIRALGNVNVAAIEEYKEVSQRYEFLNTQVKDVEKSKQQLHRMIMDLSQQMKEIFSEKFGLINQNFQRSFSELFGGGTAKLLLTDPDDVLFSGIEIQVTPPGKIIKSLTTLSGGEQALVAIGIYFAILAVNPAPFCILDEIEAALDDVNVSRYAQYLTKISNSTQFIVITHRRGTMEEADVLYGVTMQEDGVSKLLRLELDSAQATLISE